MHKKTKPKPLTFKNCSCVRIIVHNYRAQHSIEQF